MKEIIFYIFPTKPFNFDLTKRVIIEFFPTKENYKIINDCIVFSYNLSNQIVIISLKNLGELEKPKLKVKLLSDSKLTNLEVIDIKDRIIRQFSLKINLTNFYEKLFTKDSLKSEFRKLYGYHPVSFSSIEEAGTWAILTQNSTMKQASISKYELITRYSFKKNIKTLDFQAFPNLKQLSYLTITDFLKITDNLQKSNYLFNFISTLNNSKVNDIYNWSYDKLYNFFIDIKGIGVWSSEFIILRGVPNFEKVPLSEKANMTVFQKYYPINHIEEMINLYANNCGLWIHYLRIFNYLYKGAQ